MKNTKTVKFRVHQKGTRWHQHFITSTAAMMYIAEAMIRNPDAKFTIKKIISEQIWSN